MARQNRFIDTGGSDPLQFYTLVLLSDRESQRELDRLEKQRQQLDAEKGIKR